MANFNIGDEVIFESTPGYWQKGNIVKRFEQRNGVVLYKLGSYHKYMPNSVANAGYWKREDQIVLAPQPEPLRHGPGRPRGPAYSRFSSDTCVRPESPAMVFERQERRGPPSAFSVPSVYGIANLNTTMHCPNCHSRYSSRNPHRCLN